MKKIIFTLICLFTFCSYIKANSINVNFDKCIDGDTAKFIYEDEVITARFLAIDTPETSYPAKEVEPFGPEAAQYTCDRLTNSNKIILEFDENSDEKDKYDRYLVWIFVDDSLLQKELVGKGYAEVTYLYGDYKYTNELKEIEQVAKDNKLGIWSDTEIEDINKKSKIDYKEIIILIGILIISFILNSKNRKTKKVTKK